MKKMSVKKEILTIILILVAVIAIGSKVLATNSPIQIPIVNTNTTDTTVATNVTTNTTTTNTTTNVVTPTTNTTGSNYQNTTLPQTGDASDYAIFLLIVVAAIVAVYAYKKVRDYNI